MLPKKNTENEIDASLGARPRELADEEMDAGHGDAYREALQMEKSQEEVDAALADRCSKVADDAASCNSLSSPPLIPAQDDELSARGSCDPSDPPEIADVTLSEQEDLGYTSSIDVEMAARALEIKLDAMQSAINR